MFSLRKVVNSFYRGLLLSAVLFSGTAVAQTCFTIGCDWPPISRYSIMECWELGTEMGFLRGDLTKLQLPGQVENKKWTEGKNRWVLLISEYEQRCKTLREQEKDLPSPPAVSLLPEQQLVDQALKALRGQRIKMAESLLLQGANANYTDAQYNLGILYRLTGKESQSKYWLRKAADGGSTDAKSLLSTTQ